MNCRLLRIALLLWTFCTIQARADQARPNIVLIMADDFGYECVAANGGESYETPVLDRMARDGVRFENCHSQPLCTPTRVQLMTGMSNVRNYVEFGTLETSQTTFASLFRDAGYATAIVGKWQLGRDAHLPDHFGFDEYCLWHFLRRASRYGAPGLDINGEQIDYGPDKYGEDVVAAYACDFIERHKSKPFLLYYPMMLTHAPFVPTPDSAAWSPAAHRLGDERGEAKHFADMVRYMDKMIGRILEQLQRSDVLSNTLVIFTGDNGTGRPITSKFRGRQIQGGKGLTSDAGTHVPLIVQWPGKTPKGAVCRDLIDSTDFFPTICEAAGIEIPGELSIDGRSFLPQIQGKTGNPREWIYCWYSRSGGPRGVEFARNERYKLYRSGELYDVEQDKLEQHPIDSASQSPEASAARKTLAAALDQYANARPANIANWSGK